MGERIKARGGRNIIMLCSFFLLLNDAESGWLVGWVLVNRELVQ
jgi:hypothetical protein